MIQITFLGTSSTVPTAERNHSAMLLKYKHENILIDCGEGTQRQLRKAKINPLKLTKILITHWHGDHVLGLPGLFQTLAFNGYNKTLEIYGPKGTKKFINEVFKVFTSKKKIKTKVFEVQGKFLKTKDYQLTALQLDHKKAPTNGYSFEEKPKLRIDKNKLKKLKLSVKDRAKLSQLTIGKNIKIKGKTIKSKNMTYQQASKKISFIFDTKLCNNAKKLAKDSDLAIIDSTHDADNSSLASEYGHLTSNQAAQIAKQAKVKKLILTHISQRYENKGKQLENKAKKIFKNTIIAKDFMVVEV
ncbi:ribonuclease Z [archaeon]|nr:ribonuclease Z [archaeon]|tara:strand:- start:421 stop:1323 length:903 start_codon:yes stop_codon:yes gene_type:complete